jgi:hypothetical protein
MKREMTDTDVARLEQMLRQIRPASSSASKAVHEFIAKVPAATASRRPLAIRLSESRAIRRGAFVVGLAAALVIALVVSSFLVNIRATQTSGPAASDDWTWQKADGSVMNGAVKVARGYVATCTPAGMVPAAPTGTVGPGPQVFIQPDSLCTSADGATWTTPPDPRIADIPAGSTFSPGIMAQLGRVTLIASMTVDTTGNSVTDLYRSADGVSWRRVDDPQLQHLSVLSMGVLRGEFKGVAMDVSTSIGWVISSTDGMTWQRVSQLPAQPNGASIAGGLVTFSSADVVRMSRDGSNWQELRLPSRILYEGVRAELSGGGYIASGLSGDTAAQHILRSDDGVSWRVDDGDIPGAIIDLTWLDGGRWVASVQEGASPPYLADLLPLADLGLWQSFDNGRTWSRLIGPDGKQLAGVTIRVGDALGVVVPDAQNYARHLVWIGTPGKSPAPAAP